jgi:transcriptional regulator with XRE-family HTH domain
MTDAKSGNLIGRCLVMLRVARGWTQEQAATVARISTNKLSRLERGMSRPDLESAERIGRLLGFSPAVWCLALCLVDLASAVPDNTERRSAALKTPKQRRRTPVPLATENGWARLLIMTILLPALDAQEGEWARVAEAETTVRRPSSR